MPNAEFAPAVTPVDQLEPTLARRGYAVLDAAGSAALARIEPSDLTALGSDWDGLEADRYLKDGGSYRARRHGSWVVDDAGLPRLVPQRAHWQPLEYNALHGGMRRWFAPHAPRFAAAPAVHALLAALAGLARRLDGEAGPRYVETHQFRIDAGQGIGRPTPEGAHRDGVDWVAVLLMARRGIKGGETRVFEAAGRSGERFTLGEPGSMLLLDDARVIHETTPIQPLREDQPAYRDTLVVTLRRGGFLGD